MKEYLYKFLYMVLIVFLVSVVLAFLYILVIIVELFLPNAKSKPMPIEPDQILVYYKSNAKKGKLEVWYPVQAEVVEYEIPFNISHYTFVDTETIIGFKAGEAWEEEELVRYNLITGDWVALCSAVEIQAQLKHYEEQILEQGEELSLSAIKNLRYIGEDRIAFAYSDQESNVQAALFVFSYKNKSMSFISHTNDYRYLGDNILYYYDEKQEGVVKTDITMQTSRFVYAFEDTSFDVTTDEEYIVFGRSPQVMNLNTEVIEKSIKSRTSGDYNKEFTFSSDTRYLAYCYMYDTLKNPYECHVSVYDRETKKLYNYPTRTVSGVLDTLQWVTMA